MASSLDIFLWLLIIILFILSLLGVLIPLLPDTIPLWIAVFVSRFLEAAPELPGYFWGGLLGVSLLILVSDYFTGALFMKKYGGSNLIVVAAVVGLFLGPFVMGPPGILLGPFFLVFIIGCLQNSRQPGRNAKRALLSILAVFSSWTLKIILQLTLIVWFFYLVI